MIVVATVVSPHTACRSPSPLDLAYTADESMELVIIVIIMLAIKIKPAHTSKMILEEESGPARRSWSQDRSSKVVIPDTRSCGGGLLFGGISLQLIKPIFGPSRNNKGIRKCIEVEEGKGREGLNIDIRMETPYPGGDNTFLLDEEQWENQWAGDRPRPPQRSNNRDLLRGKRKDCSKGELWETIKKEAYYSWDDSLPWRWSRDRERGVKVWLTSEMRPG